MRIKHLEEWVAVIVFIVTITYFGAHALAAMVAP
jgi:hypothetical protein